MASSQTERSALGLHLTPKKKASHKGGLFYSIECCAQRTTNLDVVIVPLAVTATK